jgi:uncharacterized membrane protein
MLGAKLLYIFLISALVAAGILLQPTLTGFFAFEVGSNSRLEAWDSADPQGGGEIIFINEPSGFFSNFTALATGNPINGGGVYCEIKFNVTGNWSAPEIMVYNGTSNLYEHSSSVSLKGNYSWNVLCNGSALGYDILNVTDDIMINRYDWWNYSWKYRMKIEVENGEYNVTNWPIERDVNFTDALGKISVNGTFDENSTRLIEYNSTGGVGYEIPSQFDKNTGYSASENAAGTAIFIMNGTTENNAKRVFFLYFDLLENGAKGDPNYPTNLTYQWNGDEIEINNSRVEFYLDTNRSENTSGLYRANFLGQPAQRFFWVDEPEKTVEYMEYSNGTYNFTFDLRENVTVIEGPVRLTVVQEGDEIIFGNTSQVTGEGKMVKKYYVYNTAGPESLGTWIKVEQNYTNVAAYSIDRNSTPAGSLTFDIVRGWQPIGSNIDAYLGNTTDPYSWYLALSDNLEIVGFVNINETVSNFFVTNDTAMGRVGVHLDNTTISPGESIIEKSVVYVGRGGTDEYITIKNALRSPATITFSDPEQRILNSYTETDFDTYNRNETILITVNVTYDPYSLLDYLNVTLDNGTAGSGDDINLTMYDDGTNGDAQANDNVFTNSYNISNYENTGNWNATASMYDENDLLMNQSKKTFIITNALFVNTTIVNPTGLVNRVVNASLLVMNYRQDTWHPNATLNCTYDSIPISQDNITDYNNGSYFVTFKAPGYYGLFTLNCTANKTGNDGYDWDEFTTEALQTNLSIVVTPDNFTADNVTWVKNQSFLITVNATNTENGTAYNSSMNLQLPENLTSNSTSAWCGDVLISKSCVINFNITVLKTTLPANFSVKINVTWNNSNLVPDYNETFLNVTVGTTYVLDVLEDNVTGTVAAGIKKNINNITVRSFGNALLENVTFNMTGFDSNFNFTFEPENFSSLPPGNISTVLIWLEVSSSYPAGDYDGLLNVSSGNGGYEELPVNVTVTGTNMTLDVSPPNFTADSITYYTGQNFSIFANATNIGNATAFSVNLTLVFSDPYINTSNTSNYECGDRASAEYCAGSFNIMVSNGTPSGNYTVNVSVLWDNPEVGIRSNTTLVNISVSSNVNMIIPEEDVKGNIAHGTTDILGNFTINSTGNDPIEGMEFVIEDPASQLGDFNIQVIPNLTETAGGNLSGGSVVLINVSVTVPLSYYPGVYSGYLNITTSNSGYRNLSLEITVPTSRTWAIEDPTDLYCEHSEQPQEGTVCNVTINNTGNADITFNITPQTSAASMYNYTWTEVVDFVVENQSIFKFSVFYNVTGANVTLYNASYNISGVQASPQIMNLSIALTPFVKPSLQVNVTPQNIPQLGNVEIMATVSSQSAMAITYTYINVTRPDLTLDSIPMRRFGGSTDPYYFVIGYPTDSVNGTWGDSTLRGNYTFTVYAEDAMGLNNTKNGSFYAYSVLVIDLGTTRANSEYYQGEHGTLRYKVADVAGFDLPDVNVSLAVSDPTNRSVNVNNEEFLTNGQGEPDTYPDFELFSDSPTGTYNITAVSVYNDTPISYIITNTTVSTFTVVEITPGMLLLDLEAPAEASISDGLEVVAMITDGTTSVDPDSIMVSLYDPLGNPILQNQSMTQLSTGRYTRWYNTSSSSNQGNWRWVITITNDNNVIVKDVYSRLVGGPFDVRDITILDNEITDLSISVIIENTGDIYQDAFVQWNLTRTDTGEMLKEGMDTVRIDANTEYTYTANPTDVSYIGQVRIMFIVTYSGTERAGAYEIFNTTRAPTQPPPGPDEPGPGEEPGPGPGPGPVGPPPTAELEITQYPDEIATEAGWAQYPSVTVNNTGSAVLHNIMLTLRGIPDSWYTIQPKLIPLLNPGVSTTFVINLLVPEGAESKKYFGTLNATSNETYDEKLTSVIVFGSREELVRYQLEKLKEEFEYFKEDVNATAEEGKKDLSRVYDIVDEIQHQIDLTEGYLDAKMFDEALNSVTTGWRLLDRGRDLLRTAPLLSPMTILVIPDWMIMLILLLIVAILVLVLFISKYKKRMERFFKRGVPEVKATREMVGVTPAIPSGPPPEEEAAAARREAEKNKIEKVLNLLEREFKEGIISEKAYNELRKRNLEKLKEMQG